MSPRPKCQARSAARRCAAACMVLLLAAPAAALAGDGEADASPAGGQRTFCLGPTIGFWSGVGAIAGVGNESVRGWVSGGYSPVLVFANARTPDKAVKFNYYTAYQLNGDLAVHLFSRPRVEFALMLGYKFNSVLGHGGGVGVRMLYDLSRKVSVELSGGLALFPDAQARLDRDHAYPTDRKPSLTPGLQGGANLGLVFFP